MNTESKGCISSSDAAFFFFVKSDH